MKMKLEESTLDFIINGPRKFTITLSDGSVYWFEAKIKDVVKVTDPETGEETGEGELTLVPTTPITLLKKEPKKD